MKKIIGFGLVPSTTVPESPENNMVDIYRKREQVQ